MKKVMKHILGKFRKEIDYVIYQWHGISGRRLNKYLDLRFFSKLLNNAAGKQLFENLWRTSYELERLKFERIKYIVMYAYQNVPFYRQFYDREGFHPDELNSLEDIKKIPVLKKEIFKEAIKQNTIFSQEKRKWKVVCGETTGSTGVPTRVCVDIEAKKVRSWAIARAWLINGILPSDPFVLIWRDKGIDRREIISFFLGNFLYIPVMNIMNIKSTTLDKEKIFAILSILEKFQPKVIRGYVSALHVLGKFYAMYKSKFSIKPKVIIGSAEYLPYTVWDELEDIFECKMINLYGGTEASPIAISTTHSRELIVFEDVFHIDLLDFEGNTIKKPGQPGSILVTDLWNRYMPLIRYEIGDIAEWSGNYQLGFRTFKEVKGRKNDIFVLPGGKIVFADAWYIFFRNLDWIRKFKIIQKDIDCIEINLEVEEVKENEIELLKKKICNSFGKDITFEWKITTETISLDRGEKFRQVISHIDVDKFLK
jgi:phenylacetate-CoA ligase